MRNKVWENPTMTTLNAKETMEDGEELFLKCNVCDKVHFPHCKPGRS